MPIWFQPTEHQTLAEDELIMTSFKWNVHNHGRTMNLKWLAEIVHTNNPKTAAKFGLADGDWIELTSYYSTELETRSPHLRRDDLKSVGDRRVVGTMRVPIVTMQGIHPQAIAMSNSCGHWQYTSVAHESEHRENISAAVTLRRTATLIGNATCGGKTNRVATLPSGNSIRGKAGIKTD